MKMAAFQIGDRVKLSLQGRLANLHHRYDSDLQRELGYVMQIRDDIDRIVVRWDYEETNMLAKAEYLEIAGVAKKTVKA
jgi:hypothetical protein